MGQTFLPAPLGNERELILTIGTSLALARSMEFDRLTVGDVNRAVAVRVNAAGKSVNVARVCHALGEAVVATGVAGGHTGRELCDELSRAGVAHDFVQTALATRVCVTLIDRATMQATELIEEAPPLSDRESDELWAKLLELVASAKVVVMSGTLAPGVPAGFYAMIAKLAADAGAMAIVDAKGSPLELSLAQRPYCVKPNRAELAETLGESIETDAQLMQAMTTLIARGARSVAVTMGKDGAIYSDGIRFWRAAAPQIQVVSPIGSGDAFAAGLAVAAARQLDPPATLTLAMACGVANAMTPQAGFVEAQVVHDLMARIAVSAQ